MRASSTTTHENKTPGGFGRWALHSLMNTKKPAIAAREARGLTRAQAAKKLRLSERTVAQYEHGHGPNLYRARKMAKLYGCSVWACFTQQGIATGE